MNIRESEKPKKREMDERKDGNSVAYSPSYAATKTNDRFLDQVTVWSLVRHSDWPPARAQQALPIRPQWARSNRQLRSASLIKRE
jgi:hypothetical protein